MDPTYSINGDSVGYSTQDRTTPIVVGTIVIEPQQLNMGGAPPDQERNLLLLSEINSQFQCLYSCNGSQQQTNENCSLRQMTILSDLSESTLFDIQRCLCKHTDIIREQNQTTGAVVSQAHSQDRLDHPGTSDTASQSESSEELQEKKTKQKRFLAYMKKHAKRSLRSVFPSYKTFSYGLETPRSYMKKLFVDTRWRKTREDTGPKSLFEAFWLSLAAFVSLLLIGILSEFALRKSFNNKAGILYPAFGATAFLLFGNQTAYVAQIKNFTWGHIIATTTALIIVQIGGTANYWWVLGPLSVAISLFVMLLTETLNPPSGAFAMLLIVSSDAIKVGWWTILTSLLGTYIMIIVAIVFMDIFKFYKYPKYWRIV